MSKKTKKAMSMLLVVTLIAVIAVGGMLAYLTSEASDVNVMTLGNVEIEQHEYERAIGQDGNFVTYTEVERNGSPTGYKLTKFNQEKPLYPATGKVTGWDPTRVYFAQLPDDSALGAMDVLDGINNVQDKFVFVENTGKSDAYVRTLIAYEVGEDTDAFGDLIMASTNTFWKANEVGVIAIDNNNYYVVEYVYDGNQYPEGGAMIPNGNGKHPDGIVHPGEYTYCNLGQIYMASKATNKDVEAIDGNDDGKYNILVYSQAVQTAGFADAQTALDTAFGDITTTNHPWVDGVFIPDHVVCNLDELEGAFAEGGNILLEDDIQFEKLTTIEPGTEVYLNLNGKTITVDQSTTSNTLIWVKEGAKLTISGNGTFDLESVNTMAFFYPEGELVIENGTFTRDRFETTTAKTTGLFMGVKNTSSNVTINGGYFDSGYYNSNAELPFEETAEDIAKRGNSKDANKIRVALKENISAILNHSGYGTFNVYGGTFVGANPAWGDEGCMLPTKPNYLRPWSYYQGGFLDGQKYHDEGIILPKGYSITETETEDNRPVFTVNYSR